MTASGRTPFTIAVTPEGDRVAVVLGGTVDAASWHLVGSLLDSLVEGGDVDLVLDLTALSHVDGALVPVIADLSVHLHDHHGHVTVRTASDTDEPRSDTDLRRNVRFERRDRDLATLGPEERSDARALGVAERRVRAPHTVSRLSSTPDHEALDDALHLVTLLTAALVAGADGASVMIDLLAGIGGDERADERSRVALRSRATIALAQGIIVERSQRTTAQALAMLLRSARDSGIPVVDHAQRIVDSSGATNHDDGITD